MKQLADERISLQLQMLSHVADYARQSADLEFPMAGDGNMVIASFTFAGQPHMAASLPDNLIAKATQAPSQVVAAYISGELRRQ